MSSILLQGFRLGSWKVEPLIGAVTGLDGEAHHLEPKVMDVFLCLAEDSNKLVTRDELLDAVWSGRAASDELLTRAISELRRVLRDNRDQQEFIETIPKRGYRLIGEIGPIEEVASSAAKFRDDQSASRTGRRLGFIALVISVIVLFFVAIDSNFVGTTRDEMTSDSDPSIVASRSGNSSEKSIAVLPFVNMSDDPGNDYFSDGLAEEILNLLSRTEGLKVIGRSSSFAFKNKYEDLRVIGQKLGVSTVLEGSVRKSGDRIRVAAQLVDVAEGSHIWSETYDRTLTDIFSIQDDVAAAIIAALHIHIGPKPTRGRPTNSPEAYALYLKAKAAFDGITHEWPPTEILQEAIELDPNFAEAYELLAYYYWIQGGKSLETKEAFRLAGRTASKALDINPELALAQVLQQSGNAGPTSLMTEIEALELAARSRVGDTNILHMLYWDVMVTGYRSEALQIAERYVELEPLSSYSYIRLFEGLSAVGRTNDAIEALDIAGSLVSGLNHLDFGFAYLVENQDEIAIKHLESYLRQRGVSDVSWVSDLVKGARDPINGQGFMGERIPQVITSIQHVLTPAHDHSHDWWNEFTRWYIFFGFFDQYIEQTLDLEEPHPRWMDKAFDLVFYGTIYPKLGFTGHPKYLELAEILGIVEVWEKRGPPDFCEKISGKWVCE